jgi:hypothetical protein
VAGVVDSLTGAIRGDWSSWFTKVLINPLASIKNPYQLPDKGFYLNTKTDTKAKSLHSNK